MAKRIRMTHRAAQPPASYGWEPEHPASKPDPEADAYLIDNDGNGAGSEPSDFAEDVAPAPYAQGAAPASYGWEPDHPAAKADAKGAAPSEKKAALERKAAERKAAKCIRIAQALLGDNTDAMTIEDQAVELMDLSDKAINATVDRLSAAFLADDEGEADVEAYGDVPQNHPELGFGGKEAEDMDEADMVAEEMLAAMLAEEEADAAPEACGGDVLAEEEGDEAVEAMVAEMIEEEAAPEASEEMMAHDDEAEIGLDMVADEDPMGLSAETEASDEILAQLFGGKVAGDDEEEEDAEEGDEEDAEEEEEEKEEEKEASKKASNLKPKARKASKGAKSLGTVTKAASSEVNDLSKLWSVAPDVSDVFGQ